MDTQEKYVGEDFLYDFNFTHRMRDTDTVAAVLEVVSEPATDLVIGLPATDSDKLVQARLSVGLAGQDYVLTAKVTTSSGDTAFAKGILSVK